jgi:hypothetical protein
MVGDGPSSSLVNVGNGIYSNLVDLIAGIYQLHRYLTGVY